MAADNKTLGRFNLNGIAPAPRGVPQVEVRFDIDANGIVHVSAKDLGTGKQQSITITASSGLSDSEVDRMMEDADKYREEDEKRKKSVEVRNQGDSLLYQTDKTLKDLADKISSDEKDNIEKAKAALSEALSHDDIDDIEAKTKELSEAIYKVSERIYGEAAQANQANQANQNQNYAGGAEEAKDDDNVVDADYNEVDDDK